MYRSFYAVFENNRCRLRLWILRCPIRWKREANHTSDRWFTEAHDSFDRERYEVWTTKANVKNDDDSDIIKYKLWHHGTAQTWNIVNAAESAPLNLFEKESAPLIYMSIQKKRNCLRHGSKSTKFEKKHSCLVPGVLFTTKKGATLIAWVIIHHLFEKYNSWF